ncbi:putative F-box/kelch-repeat protein [Hordeum vulgare]|nr:putative F-box/kelch-repeat protein [Hordeum vulgare]
MDLKMVVNDQRKKKVPQRKRRTRRRQTKLPYEDLLDEIVWEILIRLPVESLVRFKLVSKAWRSIISDPVFVRAHLHYSKQKHHSSLSFLIIPQIYLEPDPSHIVSTNIRFYHCSLQQQQQQDDTMSGSASASLLYGKHFEAGEFELVSQMAHCDGLVLLPTDTNTYIFNPAMRDVLELPKSHRNIVQHSVVPIGFGVDPSTGRYKVVRSFYYCIYHSSDCHHIAMGMEVFTINDGQNGSWRETLIDPPALILRAHTAIHCKGCLFYYIDRESHPCATRVLLRFSLADETFGFTPLLPSMDTQVEDEDIMVHELDGELCATFFSKVVRQVLIWMTNDVLDPQWKCHRIINFPEQCYPIASLSHDGVLLRRCNSLFRYYFKAKGVKEEETLGIDDLRFIGPTDDIMGHAWENVCWFDLLLYTESLVPITHKAGLQAL